MQSTHSHILERHEEVAFGLPYPIIVLDSARAFESGPLVGAATQSRGVGLPCLEYLVFAVALAIGGLPVRFLGDELKFVRRVIGLGVEEFCAFLHLNVNTVKAVEQGVEDIDGFDDAAVRLYLMQWVKVKCPKIPYAVGDNLLLRRPRLPATYPVIEARFRALDDAGIIIATPGADVKGLHVVIPDTIDRVGIWDVTIKMPA